MFLLVVAIEQDCPTEELQLGIAKFALLMLTGGLIAFMSVVDALCDVQQHVVVNHSEVNPEVVVPGEGEEGLL